MHVISLCAWVEVGVDTFLGQIGIIAGEMHAFGTRVVQQLNSELYVLASTWRRFCHDTPIPSSIRAV